MQNKSFLYRVIPRRKRVENKGFQTLKKSDLSRDDIKPVNFFENCYIFSEPTFYSRSQVKQQVLNSRFSVLKVNKKQKEESKPDCNSFVGNKSCMQIKQKDKISQKLHMFTNSFDMIHSRRNNRSLSAHFNQKQVYNNPQQRLQINAFSCGKFAKKINFSQRSTQSCRSQRKKPSSKIEKVLQMYPYQNFQTNIPTRSQEYVLVRQEQTRMKNKMYRPWSPEKLSNTIEIGSQLPKIF